MKKIPFFSKLTAVLLAVTAFAAAASVRAGAVEAPKTEHAQSAYLYCIENGQVLYAYNEKKQLYPASAVKLMTGILALEHYAKSMGEVITAQSRVLRGTSGSNIGLVSGEELTAEQLIAALIIGNANDAALVLANEIGGSIDGFVTMMNDKAKELGAESTVFTNPTGMHNDSMVSCTEDLAKIASYAYSLGKYSEFASMANYSIPRSNKGYERNIHNRNYMTSRWITPDYYDPSVNGLNAGSTDEAGSCLVATKYENGLTYLCIVMGAEYDEEEKKIYSYITAKELFDWAKENFSYVKVLDSSLIVCEIPVTMSSKTDYVTLLPERSVELFLPKDIDMKTGVTVSWILDSESLRAPVASGVVVGSATVTYGDEIVGRVALITKNSVDSDNYLYVLSAIEKAVSSVWFKIAVILIFLAALAYVLIMARLRYIKKRRVKYEESEKNYFDEYRRVGQEGQTSRPTSPAEGPAKVPPQRSRPPVSPRQPSDRHDKKSGTPRRQPTSSGERPGTAVRSPADQQSRDRAPSGGTNLKTNR